ncbi:MAG TPA: hypothetical protein DCZ40_00980 [Lachnospiraceae bacterium]|nr:hypothetical protein [Lachnospiraceae bacterium]
MWIDYNKLAGWELVKEVVVGGLEWVGFSKVNTRKLLCISSQKTTIIDCSSGEILECSCEYDEEATIAYCDELPNEGIRIAGYYGGKLPDNSVQGDSVNVNKENFITTVLFSPAQGNKNMIFCNYGFYTCGFSYDGKYFVFAQDAGVTVLKRSN